MVWLSDRSFQINLIILPIANKAQVWYDHIFYIIFLRLLSLMYYYLTLYTADMFWGITGSTVGLRKMGKLFVFEEKEKDPDFLLEFCIWCVFISCHLEDFLMLIDNICEFCNSFSFLSLSLLSPGRASGVYLLHFLFPRANTTYYQWMRVFMF